ncbi:hypothetical protein [Pseudomonas tolaasii]|nr:hypothetical protein [Pseudomonas tolaasii]
MNPDFSNPGVTLEQLPLQADRADFRPWAPWREDSDLELDA